MNIYHLHSKHLLGLPIGVTDSQSAMANTGQDGVHSPEHGAVSQGVGDTHGKETILLQQWE